MHKAEQLLKLVQTPEELLETTVEEMSKEKDAGVIDLQRILELKGLKKAEMDRMLDAMKDTMSSATEGKAKLKKILGDADVFITNVRPSGLKRLGLDYASLRAEFPTLVMAQLTAWGLDGPGSNLAGYDIGAFWTSTGMSIDIACEVHVNRSRHKIEAAQTRMPTPWNAPKHVLHT